MKQQQKKTNPMEVKTMTVTPETAREWLEVNFENRPVRDLTVRRYAEAMKQGQWEENGEAIKFSDKGILMDGQHRLRAIVQSGVTIKTLVVFNLPAEVFDTLDTGATRTIGDLLSLEGEDNAVVLGPVLRLLYVDDELGSVREMGSKLARIITSRDQLETLEKHPDIRNSISWAIGVVGLNKLLSVPVAAFLHYRFRAINADQADSFFIKLARALDLDDDDPIYLLRLRLSNMSKSTNSGRIEAIAIVIKAWNAYRTKSRMKSLRWAITEEFPKPI